MNSARAEPLRERLPARPHGLHTHEQHWCDCARLPGAGLPQVLTRARVVCATLTGALAHDMRDLAFDVVGVDEAAQVRRGLLGGDIYVPLSTCVHGPHSQRRTSRMNL